MLLDQKTTNARLVNSSLDWLDGHIAFFKPNIVEKTSGVTDRKALVELAFVSMYLKRLESYANDARIDRFLEVVLDIYSEPVFKESIFRRPDLFLSQIYLDAILRATGLLDDPSHRASVDEYIHSVYLSEDLRHRELEMNFILEIGKYKTPTTPTPELSEKSIMTLNLDVFQISDSEVYTLTHAIFHSTDLGFKGPVPGLSDSKQHQLITTINLLLVVYIRDNNWDLVGELLICCHCLRSTSSLPYRLGWSAFTNSQWENGSIPGPYYNKNETSSLSDIKKYEFEKNYHTTLVGVLVGALCPTPQ